MAKKILELEYEWWENDAALTASDQQLLETARQAAPIAYAPYSHFHVAAAARLQNGAVLTGTNQENASFPVGICAERTLLGMLANLHPNVPVEAIAITYHNHATGHSNVPASPCGMCRQALVEYEGRVGYPIRLILAGLSGPVIVMARATDLLPLAFTAGDLKE